MRKKAKSDRKNRSVTGRKSQAQVFPARLRRNRDRQSTGPLQRAGARKAGSLGRHSRKEDRGGQRLKPEDSRCCRYVARNAAESLGRGARLSAGAYAEIDPGV